LHNILNQLPPQGDTISCNGTERNETKRNDFVSCFITILRNETIPFRVLVISYRWTVLSYFVPTKTRPTYICTRCIRAIWAFGGWVVYCTTHGRFSTCFHLKFAIYFLIKADFINNWYGDPTSHVKTFSSSSKSHYSIAPLLSKIVWRNICGPESCQFASVCLQTCKYDPAYHTLQKKFRLKSRNPPETLHKGNNKITELRTILQRESQNS
jgi:hypothetical protein